MRRIPVDELTVRAAVQASCPAWKEWAEVKPLFLDWQFHQCGYCQGEIGGREDPRTSDRDLYEQHVEHFRPKATVTPWFAPPHWPHSPSLLKGPSQGYSWLEKDLRNYIATCATCNSKYKKNYFPIRTPLSDYTNQPTPALLVAEEPYLIFLETDEPDNLIAFWGSDAIPHPDLAVGSKAYWRAMVTIELLGLNRQDLKVRRARVVVIMGTMFSKWGDVLHDHCDARAEFSSCAASFRALCLRDGMAALQVAYQLAIDHDLKQHAAILRAAIG